MCLIYVFMPPPFSMGGIKYHFCLYVLSFSSNTKNGFCTISAVLDSYFICRYYNHKIQVEFYEDKIHSLTDLWSLISDLVSNEYFKNKCM